MDVIISEGAGDTATEDDKTAAEPMDVENGDDAKNETPPQPEPKPAENSQRKMPAVLGREQIKKRLQSFSLMKQGLSGSPAKKIVKQPKLNLRMVDDQKFDENGAKVDEKIVIRKPSKRGLNPQEKAKATIDEIEEMKKEQMVNWELTQSQMCVPVKNFRKKDAEADGKSESDSKKRRGRRRSSEQEEKRNKERRKSSHEEKMPESWVEIKDLDKDIKKINRLKEKILKVKSPERNDRRDKRNRDHRRYINFFIL